MTALKIKICGMRNLENIREVAVYQPDLMGFIFYAHSKRVVPADFKLPEDVLDGIDKVGVFVNESVTEILRLSNLHHLNYIQLHGHESIEDCRILKSNGLVVIKVFSIGEQFDFSLTLAYESVVDFFLFDTKDPAYGGTGRRFDWSILRHYHQRVPFFLSGGLGPDNIAALKQFEGMNLYGLDLNSGVESAPGLKDLSRVEQLFMKLSRGRAIK